jgi:hypothetical protein
MVFHRLYGLLLKTNIAIPGVPVLPNPDGIIDAQIRLRSKTPPLSTSSLPSETFYVSQMRDENGDPVLRAGLLADAKHLSLVYSDGTRFVLECRGNEVFGDWPDPLTLEDIAPYLVGPVLGVVLRLRGIFPLHASAVSIGNQAIAFVGPAGAGKSTTAAAFARCGYRVISDDVVALRQEGSRFGILPGYPRVNLWAESVHAIFGSGASLPLISPSWDKHFMPLDPFTEFETRPLPLGGLYVLQRRAAGITGPVVVEQLTGAEALVALLGNTYMNYLPDLDGRRREFELLGRVVAQVPVRRIQAAGDLSALPELCATIAADMGSVITVRLLAKAPSRALHSRP